jgi:transcriptional antiterminator
MTQRERDRLVVLKKAQKKLITQRQAAEELKLSERQIRRLLVKLKKSGDRAVIHGLRGHRSNRRLAEQTREKAVRILSQEVYRGFGPTWPASIWRANTS